MMKKLLSAVLSCFILFLFSCIKDTGLSNFYSSTEKISLPPSNYKLVWSDEFSGDSLDLSKWSYRGLGRRGDGYITKDAVKLDKKGRLLILSYVRNDSFFSGMIGTQGKFEQAYGYFECRAELNRLTGHYPAFWLQSPGISNPVDSERLSEPMSSYNGAEIDIFEYFYHSTSNRFVSNGVYYGGYGANIKHVGPWVGWTPQLDDGFHTFGLEWTPDKYIFNIDGHKTWETTKGISNVPEYLILSDIMGIGQDAPHKTSDYRDTFTVDYVKVYQK